MVITAALVCLVLAFLLFLAAAFGQAVKNVSLEAFGLALLVLGLILSGVR